VDLKRFLDRAEEALHRGQAEFAVELCDQVLEFAPGEARAGGLMARALLECRHRKGFLGRLGAGPASLAARLSQLTRNPDAEARSRRRAFMRHPADPQKGFLWGEALEKAGYAAAALAVFATLAENDGEAAKRAGALAAAQGDVAQALEFYQQALDANPRDTEALRARKNLAAEEALRTQRYSEVDDSRDLVPDQEAFRRAARGEEPPADPS